MKEEYIMYAIYKTEGIHIGNVRAKKPQEAVAEYKKDAGISNQSKYYAVKAIKDVYF